MMIRPFCGVPPPETKKQKRSVHSCSVWASERRWKCEQELVWGRSGWKLPVPPTRNSELWDGTNKGVPGSAQFGRVSVSETRRAAKPRAANRRLGRQRRRCVPKQEKQYKKHKNKEHLGENAGPSFTSCCFARGHATSMVPSLRHLFSPQSHICTDTDNEFSIHPSNHTASLRTAAEHYRSSARVRSQQRRPTRPHRHRHRLRHHRHRHHRVHPTATRQRQQQQDPVPVRERCPPTRPCTKS